MKETYEKLLDGTIVTSLVSVPDSPLLPISARWPRKLIPGSATQFVPLSRHSTLPELQRFVTLFKPKRIVPNTVLPHFNGADWASIPSAFGDCMAPGAAERVYEDMRANGYRIWNTDTARRHGSDAHSLVKAATSDEFGEFGLFTSTVDNYLAPPGADESPDSFTNMLREVFRKATRPGRGSRKLRTLEHFATFLSSGAKDEDEDEDESQGNPSSQSDDMLPWKLDWSVSNPATSHSSKGYLSKERPMVKVEDTHSDSAVLVTSPSPTKSFSSSSMPKTALTPTENLFPTTIAAVRTASPILRTRSENSPLKFSPGQISTAHTIRVQSPSLESSLTVQNTIISTPIPDTNPRSSTSSWKEQPPPPPSRKRKTPHLTPVRSLVPTITPVREPPSRSSIAGSGRDSPGIPSSAGSRPRKRHRSSLLSLIERCDRAKQSSQTAITHASSVISSTDDSRWAERVVSTKHESKERR